MNIIKRAATAGAVAAIGLGLGAAGASAAYSISGGSFTSTASSTHRFTVGGSYTITCSSTVFSGAATGADGVDITPAISGCRFLGFPSPVTQSGPWNFTATGGDSVSGYTGSLTIPAGTTTTWNWPLAGCSYTVAGPQTFAPGVNGNMIGATNWTSGVGFDLTATFNNVVYTSAGSCPWGVGTFTNGIYTTGGVTELPGITITGP